MTTQQKKKRRGRPKTLEAPACHPDREAYARLKLPGHDLDGKVLCFNCYRNTKFSGKYDRSEAVSRYQRKQRILCSLAETPKGYLPLKQIFENPIYTAKIKAALEAGNQELLSIWNDLSEAHQRAINNADH